MMLASIGLCISPLVTRLSQAYHVPTAQEHLSDASSGAWTIPTIRESAVQARRILQLENIATLSTVFPDGHEDNVEVSDHGPADLSGIPIGLMDYYADCEISSGNPTILAVSIATSFKNSVAGSNVTMSLRWHPQDGQRRSAANLPRFSLIGHLEHMSEDDIDRQNISACFVKRHPDATAWTPGNSIHQSYWSRLIVEQVYWIGGFGDRAYIGWILASIWTSITQLEIDRCRLPGEV